ncbi:GTPase-activating Rap/Ran-GAP domain-like protein 3 [Camarhynchus parvulus]|uniref:GTPase-activating Rap/Ran-GAP domain-like protein 3 n=1 Tax=Geospiza parvula TaxID=87175 RepID=UPI001237C144|nr:GTPase-activating Rap/Ran-GAP domain-like protein 3 [Camarhynchus parvulus]
MARGTASARSARAGSFRWHSAMSLDKFEKSPREIFHPEIQKGSVNFKFGVLYAKDVQLTDDEMFSNGEFFTFSLIVLLI